MVNPKKIQGPSTTLKVWDSLDQVVHVFPQKFCLTKCKLTQPLRLCSDFGVVEDSYSQLDSIFALCDTLLKRGGAQMDWRSEQ